MANFLAVPIHIEALFIPDDKGGFKETKGYSSFFHSKNNTDKKTQGFVSQPYLKQWVVESDYLHSNGKRG